MLKPLIPSIPSKELLIEGKFYRVYKQVNWFSSRSLSKEDSRLHLSINGHRKSKYIKNYGDIKDIQVRDKAIHLFIENVLSDYHDYIEKNYHGDGYMKVDRLNPPRVYYPKDGSSGYVLVQYVYKLAPEEIVKNLTTTHTSKSVGRPDVVNQKDIDRRINEAKEHQRVTIERLKAYATAKRTAFREQVNKEIAERDSKLA